MNTTHGLRNKWLSAIALLTISSSALSAEPTTLDSIATAALLTCPTSTNHECAGVVIAAADGTLTASVPVRANEANFVLRIKLAAGEHLAAIYHSHPGDDKDSQVFSSDDVRVARQLRVPSYVLFIKASEVRKYVPEVTRLIVGEYTVKTSAGDPLT